MEIYLEIKCGIIIPMQKNNVIHNPEDGLDWDVEQALANSLTEIRIEQTVCGSFTQLCASLCCL